MESGTQIVTVNMIDGLWFVIDRIYKSLTPFNP